MPAGENDADDILKAPMPFVTTRWSVVLRAADQTTPEAAQALETLCRNYWYPLYAFVRRRSHDPEHAKDVTQEFFAGLLVGSGLAGVRPEKGRFRTFLLAALKHFLANEWRDAHRLKRGGGKEIVSWDGFDPEQRYALEPADGASDDALFDRRWAATVVTGALQKLGQEMEREGVKDRFDRLKGFLQGDGTGLSYTEAGAVLGLSEPAVKSAIFRMRRRYGELIREEIAQTVDSPAEVETEIQYLIAILAGK